MCEDAANFLENIAEEPLFDLSEDNFELYSNKKSVFPHIRRIRHQLYLMRPYVHSCRSEADLLAMLHPFEHFLDEKHSFSLHDLSLAHQGTLIPILQKFVNAIHSHCIDCVSCRARGFICDICNKNDILFSFEIDRTARCDECGHVFHVECMNLVRSQQQECLVCARIRRAKGVN